MTSNDSPASATALDTTPDDERETLPPPPPTPSTSRRLGGFATMDPAKQREIARKGGRAAHEMGTAHRFSSDEAKAAGKKGGATVSADRVHMAAIGKIGGQARGRVDRLKRGMKGEAE